MAGMPDAPDLPLSWAKFAPGIGTFAPPAGPFDPSGPWELRWRILVTVGGMDGGARSGTLQIRREPGPDGSVTLRVVTRVIVGGLQQFVATGILNCGSDDLTGVARWEMVSFIEDSKAGPIESTRIREHGVSHIEGARVTRGGIRELYRCPNGPVFTSNWSLFDAVQRLAPDAVPRPFDMLEDLTLLRRDQRITPGETREIRLGEQTMRLRSFRQIGEGILPTHYWIDASGRLVFASCGLRGYLLETGS